MVRERDKFTFLHIACSHASRFSLMEWRQAQERVGIRRVTQRFRSIDLLMMQRWFNELMMLESITLRQRLEYHQKRLVSN